MEKKRYGCRITYDDSLDSLWCCQIRTREYSFASQKRVIPFYASVQERETGGSVFGTVDRAMYARIISIDLRTRNYRKYQQVSKTEVKSAHLNLQVLLLL
jgi:hypothetical protein